SGWVVAAIKASVNFVVATNLILMRWTAVLYVQMESYLMLDTFPGSTMRMTPIQYPLIAVVIWSIIPFDYSLSNSRVHLRNLPYSHYIHFNIFSSYVFSFSKIILILSKMLQ